MNLVNVSNSADELLIDLRQSPKRYVHFYCLAPKQIERYSNSLGKTSCNLVFTLLMNVRRHKVQSSENVSEI